MKRFKNIVFVASDFIDDIQQTRALEQAIAVAKENEATLTLVDAVESLSGVAEILVNTILPARRLQEFNVQQRRSELQQLVGEVNTQGLKVSVRVLVGKPFIEITKATMEGHYDLIIKLVDKTPEGQRLISPNDLQLVRKCPCAVWLLNNSQTVGEKILAVINANASEPDTLVQSRTVVDLALSMAKANKAALHIVQCWDAPGVSALYGMGKLSKEEMDGIHEFLRGKHEATQAELVAAIDFGDVSKHTHLLKGKPDFLINALAKQEGIDLIVMSSLSDTKTPGVLIDSTAEAVLTNLKASALTIKPTGFDSPVAHEAPTTDADLDKVLRS